MIAFVLSLGGVARAVTPDPEAPTTKIEEPSTPEVGKHQLGARTRYIFCTRLMLAPYFKGDTGTELNSFSVAIEYVYRRPGHHYDVVTSVDFSAGSGFVNDGNFLSGIGDHPANQDTHYVQFQSAHFLSADVSIIGWHKFTNWLELRYGGGLGIGWITGDVKETNNNANCTDGTARDTTKCYPTITGPINGKPTASQEAALKASETGAADVAGDPHRHSIAIPVFGVVNVLLGLRFYPIKHMAITYEIGFRDVLFTGLGIHYLF
jgi:hypothetical protein